MRAKRLAALAALGAGVFGAIRVGREITSRTRYVDEHVAPELRSPLLMVPLPTVSLRAIRLLRKMPLGRLFSLPPGVRAQVRTAYVSGREPVAVHLYEPRHRTLPSGVLLWIHGGGYLFGSAEMGQSFGGRVARELGVLVVSVEYRLAPEHPFPAPLADCYTALRWVHDRAEELGVDPERIAVGGESAGGGLAATLVQLAHDRGEVPVCFQLLVYPMTDDRTALRADHGDTGRVGWDPQSNLFGWTSYLGRPPVADSAPEYAVAARREDLTGLPPAWVGVGDIDLFHDEDVEYAERLRAARIDVELHVVPGMPHGADTSAPDTPLMREFTDRKVAALRRFLVRE
ncbi:MAG: alpha/beta hydrolase [Intrasporangiaceae bacterium]|nr:alpha/beta hydrolase [Intrasporangiaceae bacterium]